jgi:hypothetical protein
MSFELRPLYLLLAAGPTRTHLAPGRVHAQQDFMQALDDRYGIAFLVYLVQRPISDGHVLHAGSIKDRAGMI